MKGPNSRMRVARFYADMTLGDIFLKTGIHQPKLSQIERGIFKPTDDEKDLIAEALGKIPEQLF